MQSLVHPFTDVETAYRSERITGSFRAHAAGRHRQFLRRQRDNITGPADITEITTQQQRSLRVA